MANNREKPLKNLSAGEATARLVQGNARFITGLKSVEALRSSTKTRTLAEEGQYPFCVVVTDSDSRIPIEFIFDRGLGDLFVIRNFGSLVDPNVIASIEYGILNFDIRLVLVLGHSRSGAVRMTMENESDQSGLISPSCKYVVDKVKPALELARRQKNNFSRLAPRSKDWDAVARLTCLNSLSNTQHEILEVSDTIRTKASSGELEVITGFYQTETGRILFNLGGKSQSHKDIQAIHKEAKVYEQTVSELITSSIKEFEYQRDSKPSRGSKAASGRK